MQKNPLLVGLTLLLLLSVATQAAIAASAKQKRKAKKHFKAALALLETEDYSSAAVEFERSIALYPTKNALFNLANCHKAEHRYGDAIRTVERLKTEFNGKLDEEWQSEIASFETTLKSMTARLTIVIDKPGAQVKLDGEEIGHSPIDNQLILAPGNRQVGVSLKGHEDVNRTITLHAEEIKTVQFNLNEIVEQPDPSLFEPTPQPHGETVDVMDNGAKRPSGLFWAGVGATAVTGAASGIFLALANARAADHDAAQPGDPNRDALADESKKFGWTGVGFGIAAGAFAVGTIVVLIVDLSVEPSTDSTAARLSVGPNGIGINF